MTVRIDADRCKGHARCMLVNPDLFGMDDEGHGLVTREPAPGELADVRAAIANCPERAITYGLARAGVPRPQQEPGRPQFARSQVGRWSGNIPFV
jgi:ferredoxin